MPTLTRAEAVLSKASELRALSEAEAKKGLRFDLTAQIIHKHVGITGCMFVVRDETGGVSLAAEDNPESFTYNPGDIVRLGKTHKARLPAGLLLEGKRELRVLTDNTFDGSFGILRSCGNARRQQPNANDFLHGAASIPHPISPRNPAYITSCRNRYIKVSIGAWFMVKLQSK